MKLIKWCFGCVIVQCLVVVVLMGWQLAASAGPLPDADGAALEREIQKRGILGVNVLQNVKIPITNNPAGPDTQLWATAIYKDDGVQRPTILIATAYRRGIIGLIYLLPFLQNDYNVVSVDMRGTGSSEGVWNAMDPIEQYDVVQVIDEWIPAQPWSDGTVGMVGGSYMGILQYQVAALVEQSFNPATGKTEATHLKAIAPLASYSDAYRDIAMHGGNFDIEFMAIWITLTDLLSVLPPAVFESGTALNADTLDYFGQLWQQHIDQLSVPFEWIMNPDNIVKNDWYLAKSPFIYWPQKPAGGWQLDSSYPAGLGDKVIPDGLPVFAAGGWFDIFTRGSLNNFEYGLANHDASDKALVMGPWYHIGAAVFAPGVDGIGLGNDFSLNSAVLVRWFDWKMKGQAMPLMEEFPVLSYVLGAERWKAEKSWPLAASRRSAKTYYLSKRNADWIFSDWFSVSNSSNNYKLVETAADKDYYSYFLWYKFARDNPVLEHNPPRYKGITSRSAQRWLGFSPLTLVTQFAKYLFGADLDPILPWEDERNDEVGALTFTTAPLSRGLELVGPLKLTFWAKTRFGASPSQSALDDAINQLSDQLPVSGDTSLIKQLMNQKDVQWVVELNDVFADGRARNITSGWLSAAHRPYDPYHPTKMDPAYTAFDPFYDHPDQQPQLIAEDTVYPYVVELWPTHNVFKKGHRIRVSISASDVPHLLPIAVPSDNTLVIDNSRPARLEFDVASQAGEGTEWQWVDNVDAYLAQ